MRWDERSVNSRRARQIVGWAVAQSVLLWLAVAVERLFVIALVAWIPLTGLVWYHLVRTPCTRCRHAFPQGSGITSWWLSSACVYCSLLFDENWPHLR